MRYLGIPDGFLLGILALQGARFSVPRDHGLVHQGVVVGREREMLAVWREPERRVRRQNFL